MSLWRWRTFSFSAYSRAASVSGRAGGSAPGSSQLRVMSVSSPANNVKPSVRGLAGLNRADRGYSADARSSGCRRRRNESRGSIDSHHPSNTCVGLLHSSPPSTYSSAFASPVTRSYTERRLIGCRRTGRDMDMRVATRTAMFGVVLMWQNSVIIRVTLVTGIASSRPHRSCSWANVMSALPVTSSSISPRKS